MAPDDATTEIEAKPRRPKRTPEELAEQRARTAERKAVIHTPALDAMDAIDDDPAFSGYWTGPFAKSRFVFTHDTEEDQVRRTALHREYERLCIVRREELAAKFGKWPLSQAELRELRLL